MNTLIVLIVMAVSLMSSTATQYPSPEEALRNEIKALVGNPNLDDFAEGTQAMITFTLNEDNEIVVLNVITNDVNFDRYIKTKLNYQNVSTVLEHDKARTFSMPIRVSS